MKRRTILAIVLTAVTYGLLSISCSTSKCSNNVGFSGYGHKTEKILKHYGINPKKF